MTSATAGSGMKWVGRAIRRLEDPALVSGRGRFTADLAGKFCGALRAQPCRFWPHRPHCSARRRAIVRGADLVGVRPIRPMLHKFNYQPIEQPILARDVVRFVGEPVAAVFAPTAAEAEDIADRVELEIDELPAVVEAREALAPDAPRVHDDAGNVDRRRPVQDARTSTPRGPRRNGASGAARVRTAKTRRRWKRAPRTPHSIRRPGRTTLTCATQMPHLTRTAIADFSALPNPICAWSRPMSVAASDRKCRCRSNMSSWSGWRESSRAASPGARTGAKT